MNDISINKIKNSLKFSQDILGKDKFFNAAVLIPLISMEGEYHFIFEKRADTIRQGGEVSFPGGEFDSLKDKDYKDAAIRETFEELGITKENISVIGRLGTFVGPMGVTVDPFVGVINLQSLKKLSIDSDEVEKVFTIPISYFLLNKPKEYFVRMEVHPNKLNKDGEIIELFPAKKLKLPERYHGPWKGRKHRVLLYDTEPEIVWGITAELIYELCKLIIDYDKRGNKEL